MLSPTLWAYKTSVNIATDFTPFLLVYGVEAILPIGCKIHLLKQSIEMLLAPRFWKYHTLTASSAGHIFHDFCTMQHQDSRPTPINFLLRVQPSFSWCTRNFKFCMHIISSDISCNDCNHFCNLLIGHVHSCE
jgi:hypothetical protein